MAQHIHNLLQIHEHFPSTVKLRATHADLVKSDPIANVRRHIARCDGTVKGVDSAGGGFVGVFLEIPLVPGA
jgi:hypothetical protein